MKTDKFAIANALALTTVIFWIICTIVVLILPDFSLTVTKWWMHGLDISVMGTWDLTVSNVVLGGITLAATAWVIGYIFGWAREIVSKK